MYDNVIQLTSAAAKLLKKRTLFLSTLKTILVNSTKKIKNKISNDKHPKISICTTSQNFSYST